MEVASQRRWNRKLRDDQKNESYYAQYSYSYSESSAEVDLRSNVWRTEYDEDSAREELRSAYERNDWRRQRKLMEI